ncbi:MAG: hypothetical protein WBL46_03865, partial [Nitrososphaeraceae archaeon]
YIQFITNKWFVYRVLLSFYGQQAPFCSLMHIEFRLNYDLYSLSLLIVIIMKAKCGHVTEKSYADAHGGLCRKCHSNFSFLLELE